LADDDRAWARRGPALPSLNFRHAARAGWRRCFPT
jgi:hypothetical protein